MAYAPLRFTMCRCSSVVEHVIGNDGVVSSILISGTTRFARAFGAILQNAVSAVALQERRGTDEVETAQRNSPI